MTALTGAESQQRLVWESVTRNSGGASLRHRSMTFGQRGWNAQPGGGADGSGGWVHTLTLDNSNQVTERNDFDDGLSYPVSFARDADGNVYVVDFGAGKLFKYVYAE